MLKDVAGLAGLWFKTIKSLRLKVLSVFIFLDPCKKALEVKRKPFI
jgi:hypothetical protein